MYCVLIVSMMGTTAHGQKYVDTPPSVSAAANWCIKSNSTVTGSRMDHSEDINGFL